MSDEPLGVRAFRIAREADVVVLDVPVLPGVDPDTMADVAKDLKKGPSILRYTEIPARHWDQWLPDLTHHLVALDGEERRVLTPERDDRYPDWSWDVSDDGSLVVFERRIDGIERLWATELVAVDVAKGAQRVLIGDAHHALGGTLLSPDGATVVVSRNEWVKGKAWDNELVLVSVADSATRVIAADWDIHALPQAWSRDGAKLLAAGDERGSVPLVEVDVQSGARRVLIGDGSVHSVSVGANSLVAVRSSITRPPHLVHVQRRSP